MPDEISPISLSKQLREQGVPMAFVRAICVHGGRLLTQYSTEVSEMDRIYYLPGTPMKWGERGRDTLRKDLSERFSIEASIGRFIIALENKYPEGRERVHYVEFIFEVTIQSTEFAIKVPGIGLKWLDTNELDRYNMQPSEIRDGIFTNSLHRLKHLITGDLKMAR